jgi:hypothetical protein
LFVFILFFLKKKKKKFMSLFCSFGEIIHGIVFEHTNAKGTTYGESVAETLPKKKNCPFCEFLIFGVFVCASVLIFIFFFNFILFIFGYFNL